MAQWVRAFVAEVWPEFGFQQSLKKLGVAAYAYNPRPGHGGGGRKLTGTYWLCAPMYIDIPHIPQHHTTHAQRREEIDTYGALSSILGIGRWRWGWWWWRRHVPWLLGLRGTVRRALENRWSCLLAWRGFYWSALRDPAMSYITCLQPGGHP